MEQPVQTPPAAPSAALRAEYVAAPDDFHLFFTEYAAL